MSPGRPLPSIDQQLQHNGKLNVTTKMADHQIEQKLDHTGDAKGTTEDGRNWEHAKEEMNKFSKEAQNPVAANGQTQAKSGITFAHQEALPRLPIPDLDETCKRYLGSLEPLQTSREHQESENAVDEFLRTDGPVLQEKLKSYSQDKTSYIEQFWYDSYLNFDNPVVLNLNPFFLLEDDPTPARNNQVTRAASLVISALSFVRAVRKEELPPDMIKDQPLCMYQYSRMFGTARIPTDDGCQIGMDPTSKHVVVLCKGQFYWFDALDDNNDLIMTEKDVSVNLQVVVDDAEQTPIQDAAKGAVGVLSTENRKVWSGLREVLSREEGSNNYDCLNIVDSALFILCLDYTEPKTSSDLCMNMLCGTSEIERGVQVGTCTNRWYDKLQIIVCKNGSAGINFEHTGVDGHTVLRFASDVYTDTILRFAKSINGQAPSLWTSTSPDPSKRDPESFGDVSTTPHKLEWDMIPEVATALRFAETRLADLIQQNEFATLEFEGYGKNFMTSMGFSPDAFVQMAYQAAYYGMYGRLESMYEPAMTKQYFHGRTEAIRQVTPESVEFVRTFWAEKPADAKIDALRKAAKKHTAITKECSQALGHDRHLYALMCLWQREADAAWSVQTSRSRAGTSAGTNGQRSPNGESKSPNGDSTSPQSKGESLLREDGESSQSPIRRPRGQSTATHSLPALYADNGWDRIQNTVLSTSNCGNPSLRHFGFGPASGDGFGIGYIIKEGSVSICASSKHRQTKRFMSAIEAYFIEVRKLLRQTQKGQQPDKGASRVREVEHKRPTEAMQRRKSRGKIVGEAASGKHEDLDFSNESEDDMGGYGFFDAGMLMQALRAKENAKNEAAEKSQPRRSSVGKKLRLSEY